jgi:hypothetical protein
MTGDQMIESGARAIARSQGHDPDDLAPRAMMCTADNQQVQWWRVFEEQAEACLADATARIEALEVALREIAAGSVRSSCIARDVLGITFEEAMARAVLDKDAGI